MQSAKLLHSLQKKQEATNTGVETAGAAANDNSDIPQETDNGVTDPAQAATGKDNTETGANTTETNNAGNTHEEGDKDCHILHERTRNIDLDKGVDKNGKATEFDPEKRNWDQQQKELTGDQTRTKTTTTRTDNNGDKDGRRTDAMEDDAGTSGTQQDYMEVDENFTGQSQRQRSSSLSTHTRGG